MGDYSKFISPKRRSVPTPKDMVVDGKCVFGTFDKEFETMDMLHIDRPTAAPNEMNHIKFSCWEATEVNFDEFTPRTEPINVRIKYRLASECQRTIDRDMTVDYRIFDHTFGEEFE